MCLCLDRCWAFRGSVSSSLGFQRKRTVHMGGEEGNTKVMALDTGILNSVRAVGFPTYSPSSQL